MRGAQEEVQLKDCPRCKAKHGWYEKRTQWGEQYYTADGEPSHYCDTNGSGGVRKYCPECNRNITRLIGKPNPSLQGTGHLVARPLQGVVRLGNQKEESR